MIKSIVLEIEGKLVTIPMDKARELYEDLDSFFGKGPKITYPLNPVNPFDTSKYVNPIQYGTTQCTNEPIPSNN